MNGILFPDRRVQPAYWGGEARLSVCGVCPEDLPGGVLAVVNNYDFTNLSKFELLWAITADGRTVQEGSVSNHSCGPEPAPRADGRVSGTTNDLCSLDIDPKSRGQVRLRYDLDALPPGAEHHLNLRLIAPAGWGTLPKGHVLAEAQFQFPAETGAFVGAGFTRHGCRRRCPTTDHPA